MTTTWPSLDEAITLLTSSPTHLLTTGLALLIATTILIVRFKQRNKTTREEGKAPPPSPRRTNASTTGTTTKENTKLRNVFDINRSSRTSTPAAGNHERKGDDKDKPFGSSYYYAHNSAKSNGGYKDGLRTEDYVMNGPRLLSRNGVSVDRNDDEGDSSEEQQLPVVPPTGTALNETKSSTTDPIAVTSTTRSTTESSIPINRYLWDDDGNSDCIAKIYIDSIPADTSSNSVIKWADAGLTKANVMAKLLGAKKNGLMVQICRRAGGSSSDVSTRYHLHVPRMHGEAREVKILVRPKKLIVKVYKKASKVWPELASKSLMVGDKSLDYIDEDLFRNIQ